MIEDHEENAIQRALVLAELSEALDEARRVAAELAERGRPAPPELIDRIAAVGAEVDSLRRRQSGAMPAAHLAPEWTQHFPWQRSA